MDKEWKELAEKLNNKIESIDWLNSHAVYVGIPQEENERKDEDQNGDITNAELLFIHTNGSPINNIPPRPVIEPALKNDYERIANMVDKAVKYAEEGEFDKADLELKKIGMRGQNVSKAWFVNQDNGWPPNSPGVIARKRKKGSTDPKPLIDTGQLRNSITYFVESPEGRSK